MCGQREEVMSSSCWWGIKRTWQIKGNHRSRTVTPGSRDVTSQVCAPEQQQETQRVSHRPLAAPRCPPRLQFPLGTKCANFSPGDVDLAVLVIRHCRSVVTVRYPLWGIIRAPP
ncbi:hypothetical protein FKM82_027976 [Ascaphus truei]